NTFNQPEPKVYPNPTSDRLFVSNTDITGETQFEIYSIAGKILAKGLLNDNNGINIKRLNQGIYYLKIENQHFTEIIKFVKQ
ncbi:MAG: T9SS type A sorting domain-containing protein, partial [Salibacter sp.]|uniref:T9SS type A sorting domain-containing protein n=2 Tax=Salibacter sp. TaxID=2010995 RepID=UPI00286FC979